MMQEATIWLLRRFESLCRISKKFQIGPLNIAPAVQELEKTVSAKKTQSWRSVIVTHML